MWRTWGMKWEGIEVRVDWKRRTGALDPDSSRSTANLGLAWSLQESASWLVRKAIFAWSPQLNDNSVMWGKNISRQNVGMGRLTAHWQTFSTLVNYFLATRWQTEPDKGKGHHS